MMKTVRHLLGVVIAFSLFLGSPVRAQNTDSHFFDETRHNVQGEFWRFYQSVQDAETVLGYPITEEFTNNENVLVQYFQRARLELHNGQVRLSPLGALSYEKGMQLNINNPLACKKFPTGYSVCFAFLDFFENHGGLSFWGYPISPFEYQNNIIVQYFQNGRLEWHPSKPNGQQVVVGNLGMTYFHKIGEDPTRLTGVVPLNAEIKAQVLTLNIRAFPWKAVTDSTDEQAIFVIVQDQTLLPVAGATGTATVKWTDGQITTLPFKTDGKGIVTLFLPVSNQRHGGLVTVVVSVLHGSLVGQTTTSFRIWY